jgi:hypothetical protein
MHPWALTSAGLISMMPVRIVIIFFMLNGFDELRIKRVAGMEF